MQVSDAMGMPLATSFAEYWTFSRPPGASSTPQRPECPSCGAPIDIDTGLIYPYRKTLLSPHNQQKGWTIVVITPAVQNA